MFILLHRTWKDNIRSVIFDWRQRSSGRSNEGARLDGLSSKWIYPLVTQANLSAPHVCSPAVALLPPKGPRHRRKTCTNSLWMYSYCIYSSPSKNKNINYIFFIYLWVLRCLSGTTFPFWINTLGKVKNPFIPEIGVKSYHFCPSTNMALAVNNPRKLKCYQTKKTKQTIDLSQSDLNGRYFIHLFIMLDGI